jgi:serine/threonine-protein kinase
VPATPPAQPATPQIAPSAHPTIKIAPVKPAPPAVIPIEAAAEPQQPAGLRIRAEPPSGYAPARTETTSHQRGVLFDDRAPVQLPSAFPWKLVAAAAVVLTIGVFSARSYLQGQIDVPAAAAAAEAAAPSIPPARTMPKGKTGTLVVDSQPSGARVSLDGADVGVTPLKLESVASGKHALVVTTPTAAVRRSVRVEAGKLVTLDIPVYSGWVVVFSPIPLDISSGDRALGSTETGKILLPPGRHDLTLSNRDFGFTDRRTVEVFPGEERVLNVEPRGTVNVNAHPWAEVWVDGKKAGDTPIANLQVPLGTRVFIFKHPLYGERRVTATITATGAALSVDLTKP